MTERQRMVCAIALFADGYGHGQIARALDVTRDEAVRLASDGAAEQSRGTMGHMAATRGPDGKPVVRGDEE